MISHARLNVMAREKRVTAGLMEKDYVNSWILYAIYSGSLNHMLFKGGTALSKIYFPRTWRFSEDLDLTLTGEVDENRFKKNLESSLEETTAISGIEFKIKSTHFTSGYTQIKIQYNAVLDQKNTTKLDISLGERLVFDPEEKVHKFEDVPRFTIKSYSIEEILVEKIRSLFERSRARDFFDVYKILDLKEFEVEMIAEGLKKKMETKNIDPNLNISEEKKREVSSYWDTGLNRLISVAEKPDLYIAIKKIEDFFDQLIEADEDFRFNKQ